MNGQNHFSGSAPNTMNHYLTRSEQKMLLDTVRQFQDEKAQRDFHIMAMLIHSGLRVGEFTLITVGDAVAALDCGYLYLPAKNRKGKKYDHSVFLTKSLRFHLMSLLMLRRCDEPDCFLIAGRGDLPMTARNLQQRVKYWADVANLGYLNITPHFFRHTHAMNLIRESSAKEPLRIVKSVLGHRNISTTAIYTAPSREDVAEALNEIDVPYDSRSVRKTLAKLRQDYRNRQKEQAW